MTLQHSIPLKRTVKESLQLRLLKRSQSIHLSTRQQRTDHLKRRVLRSGTDKRHCSALHRTEQRILLILAETVDLINKQDRTPLCEHALSVPTTSVNHITHILDPRIDCRKCIERHINRVGYNPCKRSLPYSGRSPEYERSDLA